MSQATFYRMAFRCDRCGCTLDVTHAIQPALLESMTAGGREAFVRSENVAAMRAAREAHANVCTGPAEVP